MQKQRIIPFGYCIKDGAIIINDVESEAICWIYSQYLHGLSYLKITKAMSDKNIPYKFGSPLWNKNMVARILENTAYVGTERYPQIIAKSQYDAVQAIRTEKKIVPIRATTPPLLKNRTYCKNCGEPLYRHTKHKIERWYCKNESCAVPTKVTDAHIMSQIPTLLNQLISDPAQIEIQAENKQPLSLEITRLQNEIHRELDKRDCDEDKVRTLILQAAVEKYKLYDDGNRERTGQRVWAIFEVAEPLGQLDPALLESTVLRIFVDSSGIVTLELQNNQIISKNE